MAADLAAIRDAVDKSTGRGRDQAKACKLADAYVAENPSEFAKLRDKTLEECVQAVDVFRAAGFVDEQWKVETWLLHAFDPQKIGGTYTATVRVPTNG